MRRVLFRELKPYSLAAIARALCVGRDEAERIVARLMVRGVVCLRGESAASAADPSEAKGSNPGELYQFCFVGVVTAGDFVIVSYPKYFRDREPDESDLRQIMRVLRRCELASEISASDEEGEASRDRLPVMLALLDLYAERGVYSNYVEGRELNGSGVIDWARTIGSHLPVVDGGRPIYVEYESRRTLRDESDFVTRLHQAVLTECSRELVEAGVADLLSLDEVRLSDEDAGAFGDAASLVARLGRERAAQFVDWKLEVLDLLASYLLSREAEASERELQAVGTTSFYHVWELACKAAMGDCLAERIGSLGIDLAPAWRAWSSKKLIDVIPRPLWERADGRGGFLPCGEVDTLIPDAIVVRPQGAGTLAIYDAKYYVPSRTGRMAGQPGVADVTKQMLYQSAYRDFVRDNGIGQVTNAFLVPTSEDEPRLLARVSFPDVLPSEGPPFTPYVEMWALPAAAAYNCLLRGEEMDV